MVAAEKIILLDLDEILEDEDNGMNLTYITPVIVNGTVTVQLETEKVNAEIKNWSCALIVYVVGDVPGYNFVS